MKKVLTLFMLTATLSASAQQVLTLERCRELALANNKQLGVARVKQEMAANTRKAVRTKYLPKVDAVAGYEFFSREISLLNNDQKTTLANLGTTAV
ncbi:MAG: TolC family protein, partial [Prevotella sp.]|nr:TolC family protein [Prevotella sp.]